MRGLIVPPVTPMTDDGEALDLAAFERLCDFLARSGANALFINGTSGEFALMNEAERRETARIAVQTVQGRIPVLIHVGAASTAETVRLARHAREVGADAAVAVTPYYFSYSQPQLLEHFRAVLHALESFPLYAYTIPQCAGNDLSLETVQTLAAEGVRGIKDSSGNLTRILSCLRIPNFEVFIGSDPLALAFLRSGGHGFVSGPAVAAPELFRAMFDAFVRGDQAQTNALYRVANAFSELTGSGGIPEMKSAAAWRGLRVGRTRPPLTSLSSEVSAALHTRFGAVAAQARALGVNLEKL